MNIALKNKRIKLASALLWLSLLSVISSITSIQAIAKSNSPATQTLPKKTCTPPIVNFNAHTIFNEQDKDILFFHRWANALHITTKPITLKNEAAFFFKNCAKKHDDLAELERHLRSRKYIRDAKVTQQNNHINVETWDNWSLMPTLSFGRKGGVNTYSLGIKDRNLLGLGIDAQLQSFTNAQRSGYKLDTVVPLYLNQNAELALRIANNDDGKQNALFIRKNFASANTHSAYNIGFNSETRNDTLFQNDQTLAIFQHKIDHKTASYSWLARKFFNNETKNNDILRFGVGITQNHHQFSLLTPSEAINENALLPQFLPLERNFVYPWLQLEYTVQNYKKLHNIHLVTQTEDFNYGWHINTQLGLGNGSKDNAAWALWRTNISKGFSLGNKNLALLNLYLASDIYDAGNNRFYGQSDLELFYHLSDNWNWYIENNLVFSSNQYRDKPVTLGGDSGMRGFPLQYQHGKNSIKFTTELRYYPHINLYKLFDLAGAAFIDVGKAYGATPVANIDKGWLYSIGIGARIYSTHASIGRVVHIDLAKPFSDNPSLKGFEIRIQAKETF